VSTPEFVIKETAGTDRLDMQENYMTGEAFLSLPLFLSLRAMKYAHTLHEFNGRQRSHVDALVLVVFFGLPSWHLEFKCSETVYSDGNHAIFENHLGPQLVFS